MENAWEKHWQRFSSLSETGTVYGKLATKWKLQLIDKVANSILQKHFRVLDIGCGSGDSLEVFRRNGFIKLYGIDASPSAVKRCKRKGFSNIFLEDARKTSFPNGKFQVVFEEGLWEHYRNYEPFVKEACRLSSDYLVALQPNHFSLLGATTKIGWELVSKQKGGVREYSIPLNYFKQLILASGFKLTRELFTPFHGYSCMIFRR